MTRVLVTGGAGFIGSTLCELLVQQGHDVTGLDSFDDFYSPAIKRATAACLRKKGVDLREGDVRDSERLVRLLRETRPGAVVHLAARPGVRPSIENPELYASVNVSGTTVLLEALRATPVEKFIFGSSSSVYGNSASPPFRENEPTLWPISPYAATKLAGELLSYAFHALYKIPTLCLRFFTVYGPRQRPDLAINLFTRRIDRGEPITLFGNGSTARDYTWVGDICAGVAAALVAPVEYEVVNLGGAKTTTLVELVQKLEQYLGRKARVEWRPDQPGDVKLTSADLTKANRLLGYSPKINIDAGLQRYVEWFRSDSAARAQDAFEVRCTGAT